MFTHDPRVNQLTQLDNSIRNHGVLTLIRFHLGASIRLGNGFHWLYSRKVPEMPTFGMNVTMKLLANQLEQTLCLGAVGSFPGFTFSILSSG